MRNGARRWRACPNNESRIMQWSLRRTRQIYKTFYCESTVYYIAIVTVLPISTRARASHLLGQKYSY